MGYQEDKKNFYKIKTQKHMLSREELKRMACEAKFASVTVNIKSAARDGKGSCLVWVHKDELPLFKWYFGLGNNYSFESQGPDYSIEQEVQGVAGGETTLQLKISWL